MPTPDLRLFGIRHHGPGSAASLRHALDEFRPDIVLLECPADGEAAVQTIIQHPDLRMPVALLLYNPKQYQQASFLPFATFSPETQVLRYCHEHGAHLRCMDLPAALRFALPDAVEDVPAGTSPPSPLSPGEGELATSTPSREETEPAVEIELENQLETSSPSLLERGLGGEVRRDPISYLAELDGYDDGERWWELRFEHHAGHADTFGAVLNMMTALREELALPESEETLLREAFMRETLRNTLKQGYQRVAVVCGAWHAPVLHPDLLKREDKALLKGLKKVPIEATWIPWTYERLSYSSGYGAGVLSPAWYELLFTEPHTEVVTHWMVRAARLLRGQDLDASSAHAIEGVRLAETLAAVRGRALPGIEELQEAAVAILGGGYEEALSLVHRELVIGVRLGEVPAELPATPLQQDLTQQQRLTRLKPEAATRTLDLDLRKELDLSRSHLLHRLRLLEVPWGQPRRAQGKAGTFHEIWELQWQPDYALHVLDAGRWGNTILDAAVGRARQRASEAPDLETVSKLLEEALQAELGPAIAALVARLETLSAGTRDVTHLLAALPPLVNVLRYGNVRRTETAQVAQVVHHLVPRLCIGLPQACTGLDYDAARQILPRIEGTHQAIRLLQDTAQEVDWYDALAVVLRNPASSGLLAGAAGRLLFDAHQLSSEDAGTALGLALAPAQPTAYATAWIEGFLSGSGQLLLHHRPLFDLLDQWLGELHEDTFREIVPLLRRAFTDFSQPERRQVLELAVQSGKPVAALAVAEDFDLERGQRVLPVLRELLGFVEPAAV
ncbi:hypothetical protein J0X19_12145 [Hymenobacter sp. BT186]|uniref:Uncharacterized protein n=1 Tax=Hymenobacter telluris TaxID=2816474 RepID=A0A939EY40_9BACT|nr:DUF5682 family protein [Hymenobacter telluris]MBO0358700.1 hypothetical protein [Hymenobacter telluris]MBW3374726.1 hypothetical protein [Hymenobacter norwichensis]